MGLVVCPKHGNGFMFVCPHVSEAVVAGQPRHGMQYLSYTDANPLLAGMDLACWFCSECIRDHQLPPNGTVMAEGDDFMNDKGALYTPMCPGCFEDWRALGLG
jgi:hypothetical protein